MVYSLLSLERIYYQRKYLDYFCKTALEDSNSSFLSVDICCLIILSLINFEYHYAFTTNI